MSAAAGQLENRCAIITGASRGLGLEIARHYLAAGASIFICARDAAELTVAATSLQAQSGPRQSVHALAADVSSSTDVAQLIETAVARFGRLDILVNNAGIAGPGGAVESSDWDAWVRTIEVNLLGAVLLSRAALAHLRKAGRGKIIQLSGGGATSPLPMRSAYATSKVAVVRFMETLAEETRPYGIDVNAIAPGPLNTRMLDEVLAQGPEAVGAQLHEQLQRQKQSGGVPLSRAAELAVFLGSARSDGLTGKLISAVWDRWTSLPEHIEQLKSSDVYTLRRIVPKDRDLSWEDE